MAENEQVGENSILERELFVLLFASAVIFAVVSIYLLQSVSKDIYVSSYYALSSLFDTNAYGSDTALLGLAQPFTQGFYTVFLVSVLDGIAKVVVVGIILGTFVDFVTNINIKSHFSRIHARTFRNHLVICGFNALSERICKELVRGKTRFIVVERNRETANVLRDIGYTVVDGDFTNDRVLEAASIRTAKAVVFVSENDYTNLLGIVTARHLNPGIRAISRAHDEYDVAKMRRAGAKFCIVPEIATGVAIGNSLVNIR